LTWIGADVLRRGAPPFVQVGTYEAGGGNPSGSGYETRYFAFWSDTARRYDVERLFVVHAGGLISARLTFTGQGATVWIRDQSGGSADFPTGEGRGSRFQDARWIQEDLSSPVDELYRYPRRITPVTFSRVRVNDAARNSDSLISQEMTENGYVLAPGPLSDDAVGFHSTPSTPG
jgi:hypothetical protein